MNTILTIENYLGKVRNFTIPDDCEKIKIFTNGFQYNIIEVIKEDGTTSTKIEQNYNNYCIESYKVEDENIYKKEYLKCLTRKYERIMFDYINPYAVDELGENITYSMSLEDNLDYLSDISINDIYNEVLENME